MTDTTGQPEELLRAARAGDPAAFGALLERYRRRLAFQARRRIGRRLRGKVDPADLVQEAFLDAHRNFAGFVGTTEAALRAWLRQILATRIADLMRRYVGARARDVRLEARMVTAPTGRSRGPRPALVARTRSPGAQAAHREQARLLADALDRLPPHYREVIRLRQIEGLPLAQVAGRMGRSPDAVQKLWRRGLGMLRKMLQAVA